MINQHSKTNASLTTQHNKPLAALPAQHAKLLAFMPPQQGFIHDQQTCQSTCFFAQPIYQTALFCPPSIRNILLLRLPCKSSFVLQKQTKPHAFFAHPARVHSYSTSIPEHMLFCPPTMPNHLLVCLHSNDLFMTDRHIKPLAPMRTQRNFVHDQQAYSTMCFYASPAGILHDQPAFQNKCFFDHPA